ncbi:response regulator [Rhizobium grahamii]|uniref:Response regulator n=2 Tax=Rhizobium/Agrobacterium group TaxID=227290 RepID=A0A5Q0C6Q3_9HYPH|nr:response regulator [Rhizobium grahamii]QRM49734.1 response regulator [Rhizobium sp. BG6]
MAMMFSELLGRRVLVMEDDYLQASNLTVALEDHGSDVVGPFSDLQGGMSALSRGAVDVAILDIRLGTERVFELADRLAMLKIPFLFVTGYDGGEIPERFKTVQRLLKPVELDEMMVLLAVILSKLDTRH